MRETRTAAAAAGDTALSDARTLWHPHEDEGVRDWLDVRDWQLVSFEANELMAQYDRAPASDAGHATLSSAFVECTRGQR